MAMKKEFNINGLHDKGKGGVKVGRKIYDKPRLVSRFPTILFTA